MTYSVWQSFITNGVKTISGAVVSVYHEGSGAPAALFSSPSGGSIGSSVTSDSSGLARFYVAAGVYRITVTHASFSAEHRHVRIGEMAGVDDAPSDGKQYARKDGDWEEVGGSFLGDVTKTIGSGMDFTDIDAAVTWAKTVAGKTLTLSIETSTSQVLTQDIDLPTWEFLRLTTASSKDFDISASSLTNVLVKGGTSGWGSVDGMDFKINHLVGFLNYKQDFSILYLDGNGSGQLNCADCTFLSLNGEYYTNAPVLNLTRCTGSVWSRNDCSATSCTLSYFHNTKNTGNTLSLFASTVSASSNTGGTVVVGTDSKVTTYVKATAVKVKAGAYVKTADFEFLSGTTAVTFDSDTGIAVVENIYNTSGYSNATSITTNTISSTGQLLLNRIIT